AESCKTEDDGSARRHCWAPGLPGLNHPLRWVPGRRAYGHKVRLRGLMCLLASRSLWAFVYGEGEDIGAGVVADRVEVELGSGDGVEVEVGVEDAFLAEEGSGEVVAERGDDGAAAPAHFFGLLFQVGEGFRAEVGGVHRLGDVLVAGEYEAAAF